MSSSFFVHGEVRL